MAAAYEGRTILWRPQPRQAAFMRRSEDEALYGGATGGGKSDALVIEALRQVDRPNYRGLIVRKTYPQLSELIDKTMRYYKPVFPAAKYNGSAHCWTFPSGAKIYFGSMFRTQDKYNYQGKQFDFIGVDELTHFTWDEYSYLMSRNRPSGAGTQVYMRATANPGGIGHGWVKARFITPAPPGTRMVQLVDVKKPDGSVEKMRRTRIFIPSTVFDNPALLENDPGYLGNLASLPEAEKQALLYGSWDSFSGQVFTEWRNDPSHYEDQRWTHVIKPFRIPAHWRIWRGYDFGYAKPFSVGWYAADEEGRIYRIKELYGCTGTPNEGLKIDPVEQARRIREAEQNDPMLRGRQITGVADPAIFNESQGESIAQMQEKHPNYIFWTPGDHTRLAGKMQFHYRLAFDGEGRPMFQVFDTCRHFIRTIEKVRQRVSQHGTLYQQLQQMAQQMQKMAAIIDQQNGTNISAAAGAAAQAAAGGQAAGGTADSVKSTLNGLGGVVGQSGSNSMATQAAKRAMDVNNPNKE